MARLDDDSEASTFVRTERSPPCNPEIPGVMAITMICLDLEDEGWDVVLCVCVCVDDC